MGDATFAKDMNSPELGDYAKKVMAGNWVHPFTINAGHAGVLSSTGMSLREHYAGLAMQGLAASGLRQELIVEEAIKTADALIAALEKGA